MAFGLNQSWRGFSSAHQDLVKGQRYSLVQRDRLDGGVQTGSKDEQAEGEDDDVGDCLDRLVGGREVLSTVHLEVGAGPEDEACNT